MILTFLFFWLAFAILVGVYAARKGRSGAGFFILAILLSPLIAFLIALVVQPIQGNVDAKAVESGEFRKCPYCAELVRIEAVVCKHCGRDLPKAGRSSSAASAAPGATENPSQICYNCQHYFSAGWDKSAGRCTLHGRKVKASDICTDFSAKAGVAV